MTNREESQYNMQVQVKKHLDNHTEKWANIPAILRYKNGLDETLQAINEKEQQSGENSKVITATKNELKQTAALKAAILAGSIAAFAAETENTGLGDVSNVSQSGLYKSSDSTFTTPIIGIVQAARANLEALADQGVTEDQITELETALDDFSELAGQPRHIRINSSLASKAVSELVTENQKLLNDKLDKTMLRYQLIDPLFYEGYERARVIVG